MNITNKQPQRTVIIVCHGVDHFSQIQNSTSSITVDRDKDVLGGDLPAGRRICPRQRVPGDHLDFVVFLVISFVVVVVAIANKSTNNPLVVVVTFVVYTVASWIDILLNFHDGV